MWITLFFFIKEYSYFRYLFCFMFQSSLEFHMNCPPPPFFFKKKPLAFEFKKEKTKKPKTQNRLKLDTNCCHRTKVLIKLNQPL